MCIGEINTQRLFARDSGNLCSRLDVGKAPQSTSSNIINASLRIFHRDFYQACGGLIHQVSSDPGLLTRNIYEYWPLSTVETLIEESPKMKMEKTPNEPYFVPTAIVKEELDADPIEVKEESGGTNSDDGTGEDTWECPRDPALAAANGQTQIPGHNQNTNGIRPILGSVRQEGEWLHPHPLPRGQVAIAGYGAQGQVSSQTLESDFRSIHERFDRVEAELKRISGFMEKILKYVENRHCVPPKPKIFPISTLAQMDELENANDEDYSNVVNYFRYIGGFSLKEVVNVCFKESIHDSLTSLFTWRGREEGQRPLCNCRLLTAIYEAACTNRHFQKPSRSQFQAVMREALRTAKERLRSKIRSRNREAGAKINRNFWSDEPAEDADD